MARKRIKKRTKSSKPRQRDRFHITNRLLLPRLDPIPRRKKRHIPIELRSIQDFRTRSRKIHRHLDGTPASVARKVLDRPNRFRYSQYTQHRFRRPERVITCIRRKIRRQVLFATRNTGKGSKAERRFTESSKLRC